MQVHILLARKPSQLEANKASHITTGYRYIVFVRATCILWKATHYREGFLKYQDSELTQGLVKLYVLIQVSLG